MSTLKELQDIASQVRRDIIRMTNGAASGHPGGSLGCADFLTTLYFQIMNHRPQFQMSGENEDVFILSNGHICPVWYSILAHSGYFDKSELNTFRKLNSRLQGHPTTAEHLPGVRVATGSLGQGLSVALGIALAKKQNNDFHTVYTLHGDGELQEGQIWEAALFAAHHQLDNVIATVDWNGLQIDGANDKVMGLGDLPGKWRSFGWTVLLLNGHNMQEIIDVLEEAKSKQGQGKPIVILMKTVMGKGVDFMENDHGWHGVPPTNEQTELALAQLSETLGDY